MNLRKTLTLFSTLLLFYQVGGAQEVLFQSNFDTDDGLIALPSSDDSEFEFNYDYSDFDGIPEAPNSELTAGAHSAALSCKPTFRMVRFPRLQLRPKDWSCPESTRRKSTFG